VLADGDVERAAEHRLHALKLAAKLVRGIDTSSRKDSGVRSVLGVCQRELRAHDLVWEGVETKAERDALARLGAELLQSYVFVKPAPLSRGARTVATAWRWPVHGARDAASRKAEYRVTAHPRRKKSRLSRTLSGATCDGAGASPRGVSKFQG
jgi:predicted signal transduction protein with EAL and GGDEF domain